MGDISNCVGEFPDQLKKIGRSIPFPGAFLMVGFAPPVFPDSLFVGADSGSIGGATRSIKIKGLFMTQEEIAKRVKITQPYLSMILSGERRPSWDIAKAIAELTKTEISLWMEGDQKSKRAAIKKAA